MFVAGDGGGGCVGVVGDDDVNVVLVRIGDAVVCDGADCFECCT